MRITNEQIAAEIADLTAQADRMMLSAKALGMESAKLRAQAEHLRRVLELRSSREQQPETTSYFILGFAWEEEKESIPICAITWRGSRAEPMDVRLVLRREWARLLPSYIVGYFEGLFKDWKEFVRIQADSLLAMVADLSVGPIRTIEEGNVPKEQLPILIRQKLGEVDSFPPTIAPIDQQPHSATLPQSSTQPR